MTPATSANIPADSDGQRFAAAREICRRHARTFYFASFFLPRRKRDASYAVYAFCRLLDDAVDSNPGREEEGLGQFEGTLTRVYGGDMEFPGDRDGLALCAFAATVQKYGIPRQYFDELAHGCRMDLTTSRYDTWEQLEKYCYHVAGVVGLIMGCIFGPIDEPTKVQAVAMGNAMQLTNILRDVKEDLERGRIYLPHEDLERFNVGEAALTAGKVSDEFRALMKFEIDRARSLYREGAQGLCKLADDGSCFTASAMAVNYAGILRAIERQDYDVFSRRAHLSLAGKIARIPAARRLSRCRDGFDLPDVF